MLDAVKPSRMAIVVNRRHDHVGVHDIITVFCIRRIDEYCLEQRLDKRIKVYRKSRFDDLVEFFDLPEICLVRLEGYAYFHIDSIVFQNLVHELHFLLMAEGSSADDKIIREDGIFPPSGSTDIIKNFIERS